jgi:hypothetical protein
MSAARRSIAVRWRHSGAIAASLLCLAAFPVLADAAVGGKAIVHFPAAATVGQTGVAASIELVNSNTVLEADPEFANTVCNAAEAIEPCTAPERGIVLTPSCGALSGALCVSADPGVFKLSATGVGAAASSCPGMVFDVAVIDPAFGTVRFTPRPSGAHVVLPVPGPSCRIGFTLNVLRSPLNDANPGVAGLQTAQTTQHRQYLGLAGPVAPTVLVRGSSLGTTVSVPPPPPPPVLPDLANFSASPKSLRVSKTGRFTYRLLATPGRKGKAKLASTKSVKVGSKRRKLKVAAKSFKAPTNAKVKLKFKLSLTSLKALKRVKRLNFTVSVTVGGAKFTAKLKLLRPKRPSAAAAR